MHPGRNQVPCSLTRPVGGGGRVPETPCDGHSTSAAANLRAAAKSTVPALYHGRWEILFLFSRGSMSSPNGFTPSESPTPSQYQFVTY